MFCAEGMALVMLAKLGEIDTELASLPPRAAEVQAVVQADQVAY